MKVLGKYWLLAALLAAVTILVAVYYLTGGRTSSRPAVRLNEAGDLLITTSDITSTATFYNMELDGVELEVLAVRASDGTVRTAFNTCQVCFASGRGYYVQEDDELVCQNCGNRFATDDIEMLRGGCNPIPITAEYKEERGGEIAVSGELLELATTVFSNWKR